MEIKVNDEVKVIVTNSSFFGILRRVISKDSKNSSFVRFYISPETLELINDEVSERIENKETCKKGPHP
jgi:hypothetical protein